MVYLIGKIEKIGGISGKRIYFKEMRGICLSHISLYEVDWDNLNWGSTHCFDCLVSLIEKALYIHNDNHFVIIKLENDLVIELKEITIDDLTEFAEKRTRDFLPFNNKIIDLIRTSIK